MMGICRPMSSHYIFPTLAQQYSIIPTAPIIHHCPPLYQQRPYVPMFIQWLSSILSQMQITTQDVTRLCHEIRDIKKELINNELPDTLSKVPSNIPGQWDIRDKGAPGYAESVYNKLCHAPPSDTHDSPARRDSFPPPTPSPPPQTLPELTPSRTPSPTPETSVGIPYVTVVPGSGESPADVENKARNSPCESWCLPVSSWE